MEIGQRVMIEAVLKHAFEKENMIFRDDAAIFKYLEGMGIPARTSYENTDEIEIIWGELCSIPPTPLSVPLETLFKIPEQRRHND
ncbi:hypothetical protein F5Y06DRAFT_257248, partial [Hypoxylon sp. FL0890]